MARELFHVWCMRLDARSLVVADDRAKSTMKMFAIIQSTYHLLSSWNKMYVSNRDIHIFTIFLHMRFDIASFAAWVRDTGMVGMRKLLHFYIATNDNRLESYVRAIKTVKKHLMHKIYHNSHGMKVS